MSDIYSLYIKQWTKQSSKYIWLWYGKHNITVQLAAKQNNSFQSRDVHSFKYTCTAVVNKENNVVLKYVIVLTKKFATFMHSGCCCVYEFKAILSQT